MNNIHICIRCQIFYECYSYLYLSEIVISKHIICQNTLTLLKLYKKFAQSGYTLKKQKYWKRGKTTIYCKTRAIKYILIFSNIWLYSWILSMHNILFSIPGTRCHDFFYYSYNMGFSNTICICICPKKIINSFILFAALFGCWVHFRGFKTFHTI